MRLTKLEVISNFLLTTTFTVRFDVNHRITQWWSVDSTNPVYWRPNSRNQVHFIIWTNIALVTNLVIIKYTKLVCPNPPWETASWSEAVEKQHDSLIAADVSWHPQLYLLTSCCMLSGWNSYCHLMVWLLRFDDGTQQLTTGILTYG